MLKFLVQLSPNRTTSKYTQYGAPRLKNIQYVLNQLNKTINSTHDLTQEIVKQIWMPVY